MPNEPAPPSVRPTLMARFWFYFSWRIVGIALALLAVWQISMGLIPAAIASGVFAVTYFWILPANLVSTFRVGYAAGVSDGITFATTGNEAHLRHDLHPAEAHQELRRRGVARRHAR